MVYVHKKELISTQLQQDASQPTILSKKTDASTRRTKERKMKTDDTTANRPAAKMKSISEKREMTAVSNKAEKLREARKAARESQEAKVCSKVENERPHRNQSRTQVNVEMHEVKDMSIGIGESIDESYEVDLSPDHAEHEDARDANDMKRRLVSGILRDDDDELQFEFRGDDIPVTYNHLIPHELAQKILVSTPFLQWQSKVSRIVGSKRIDINHVEILDVDIAGDHVDMIKIQVEYCIVDEEMEDNQQVVYQSGICYLRDCTVGLLVELYCIDDGTSWSLLIDQPRIAVGAVSNLELPVGFYDESQEKLIGGDIEMIEEACHISIYTSSLINLSENVNDKNNLQNRLGMCSAPGQSAEHVNLMVLRKDITKDELLCMRTQFSSQREAGEMVTLRMIPLLDLWKVTSDMKVMCALFLYDKANLASKIDRPQMVQKDGKNFASKISSMISKNVSSRMLGALPSEAL